MKQKHLVSLACLVIYHLCFLVLIGICSSTPSTGKHFVFVHGASHGGWSWYKLVPPLEAAGYNVTAIDLAASGIDPQQENSLKSISDYIKPLMDLMASLPSEEKVVLVGHSFGGFAICQAMEYFPDKISVAVFVAATMPGPDLNITTLYQNIPPNTDYMDSTAIFDNGPPIPTASIPGPKFLATRFYPLSPSEDLALAILLVRAHRIFMIDDLASVLVFTHENYGKVKRVYIGAEFDSSAKEDVEWMINHNPPDQVVEIEGADHMVMMSQPAQLVNHLLTIAVQYSSDSEGSKGYFAA